ncbi:MAG: dTMP kinase [Candidatus Omnitrophica bacterium]|nr:dTMP kinase [Candidatus Omnitrophota bacterium]MCM8798089.1 dTMP kinase [Candidatus Omnitrophota bacterium]
MRKGFFITFEGSEGSGKSTHAKRLCNFLRRKGYAVVLLREPGGTRISEAIRNILLDTKNKKIEVKTEALLYLAARAQLVKEKIIPALREGKVVILDRFQDSTLAYQGYGGGLNLSFLKKLGDFVTEGLAPDLTFLLDINIREGLRRSGTSDRIEKKPLSFHRRVRAGYLALARKNPRRFFIIEAEKDISLIREEIEKNVLALLAK